ncbi:protein ACCELERATED CELL DEATH 6-like [Carex rostrata]
MDPQVREFFKACRKGDFSNCINLIVADPNILLSTNPHMNNCLHIAAMLSHHDFANQVLSSDTSRVPYLLNGTNADGETPLMAALMAPNLSMASAIITAASRYMQHDDLEEGKLLSRMLLKVDRRNENVLHHSMRNGFENLALRLLEIEPQLSVQATNTGESPMYMAVRRGYSNIVERLLQIPLSIDSGPGDDSALYVAVESGNTGIVKQLLERRPHLAWRTNKYQTNPVQRAVLDNNLDLVKIFLEFDDNFAYLKNEITGNTLFLMAMQKGYLSIAKEILNTCPDSVYIPDKFGQNALHHAIYFENPDIVHYILRTPQLHRLMNQADNNGNLPLHQAARMCDPKFLHSLITHTGQDYTARNVNGNHAFYIVHAQQSLWNTLKWNESITLLLNVFPSGWKYFIRDEVKKTNKEQAIKEVKSLTEKYTSNTSLVAALIATITFAAAFTLPGGFSSDSANAGLPIFARKAIFQVFLISDTIAMCSSLTVAFLCISNTWEDLDFLLNYRKTTKVLMWSAYGATALAFGSGLFTVIAPNNLWLAILILVLSTILPLLSKIIGEWPLLMVRYRLRGTFIKDLVPNI